jgi:hypothetical protein
VTFLPLGSYLLMYKTDRTLFIPFWEAKYSLRHQCSLCCTAIWKVPYEKIIFTFYSLLHLAVNKLSLNYVDELSNFLPNALNSWEATNRVVWNPLLFLRGLIFKDYRSRSTKKRYSFTDLVKVALFIIMFVWK